MPRREFAVRFVPPNDSCAVPLDIYADVMKRIAEGLRLLKFAVAPSLAKNLGIERREVDRQLQLHVLPAEHGSYLNRLHFGPYYDREAELDFYQASDIFVRYGTAVIRNAAKGSAPEAIHLSRRCVEAFAEAGEIAENANIQVELAGLPKKSSQWKPLVPISSIHSGLREFAKRRPISRASVTVQVIGRIADLHDDPLSFRLKLDDGRPIKVLIHSAIRDDVRQLWGKDVLVTMIGEPNQDGLITSGKALGSPVPLVRHRDPYAAYLASRGSGKHIWDTDEAQAYLRSLRSESSESKPS